MGFASSSILHPSSFLPRFVPSELVGDWDHNQTRYRFNYEATYSIVNISPYSITNNQKLQLGVESFDRVSGTSKLEGTWRKIFDTGERLDLTFGPYGFYSYLWNDGTSGGGYYSDNATTVAIAEVRALIDCTANTITFTKPDATTETATYAITGTTLTSTFMTGTFIYTRIPF